MSTHNLCFRAKNKKIMYTPVLKPQFYYMKVGCKGRTLHGYVGMMKYSYADAFLSNIINVITI